MERRKFLHLLLGGAAVAATPKFIFDVGANLYRPPSEIIIVNSEYENAMYEEIFIEKTPFIGNFLTISEQVKLSPYPRRFNLTNGDSNLVEVFPFKTQIIYGN